IKRGLVEAWCEKDLDELLGDPLAERPLDSPVQDDDPAVGRERVRVERALVRLPDRRRDSDPARVPVLDDHTGGERELGHAGAGGGEVAEVVEREVLAVQLLDTRKEMLP